MPRALRTSQENFYTFASVFLVVTALYVGKEVCIPIALSVLLSFLLAPVSSKIERHGLGRTPSVILVAFLSFAILLGAGFVVTGQLTDLGSKIPLYRQNIKEKIQDLKGSTDQSLSFFRRTVEELRSDMNLDVAKKTTNNVPQVENEPKPTFGIAEDAPLWTREVVPPPSPINILQDSINTVLGPLGTLGIVIVLAIFMLIYREDIRDRFIRLLGEGRLNITTEALDESGSKVGRYLLMQLIVNITYGFPIGIGLFLIGIPNAALWGVMATLLRFIPYLGPWIAAAFPIALSFAISISWSLPLYTVGIFLLLELISNNVIEPWLYGRNTGVSPVAILVAAIFWTWIWGTVGLFLSTPLTVCLVVAGKYLPQLQFFTILLGDTPALEKHVRIYQRLLASDVDEASKIFSDSLGKESAPQVFENILLPALRLLEADRHAGVIDGERGDRVLQGLKELVEEVSDSGVPLIGAQKTASMQSAIPPRKILCLPARDAADKLAGTMLAYIVESISGVKMEVLPVETLAGEIVNEMNQENPPVVIISALPPSAIVHTRYLLKRINKTCAGAKVIVALWEGNISNTEKEEIKERLSKEQPFTLGVSFVEVAEQVRQLGL